MTAITNILSEKIILPVSMFGFFYGGLMNLFYNRIAKIKDTTSKTDAFSIFSLMSYFGVGLGSVLLSSVASESLQKVFYTAAVFPICALIVNVVFSYSFMKSKVKLEAEHDTPRE